MAAETAKQFAALEAQAQTVMAVFAKAGHEIVAPAIIQPAGVFLDCIGEALRARTYVFTDPDGAELCLRPDLTVPACRLHIARHADPATPAKYAYNGPAFRYQPQDAAGAEAREFRQAGIECIGGKNLEAAEVETLRLILAALTAAGLPSWSVRIGDLGLFRAVLKAVQLPERWQKRLSDVFWKPELFRHELKRLRSSPSERGKGLPAGLSQGLDAGDLDASTASVSAYLEAQGIEAMGTRTARELAEQLVAVKADEAAPALEDATARLIERYIALSCPAAEAGGKIAALMKDTANGTGAVLAAYDRRLALMANAGIDLSRVSFSAEFGRGLEYYTGFVFEVLAPGADGDVAVAGGGRYDGLMQAAGARTAVAAVGGAIHTERLLDAVARGRT